MPWKTECLRDQRWRFLKFWRAGKTTMAGLCLRLGISRKTAYKWVARFEQEGRRGLQDRSRRARVVHNRTAATWLVRIRRERLRHPTWGAKKLRAVLRTRYGTRSVPSVAAIGRWLRCWRLSRRRQQRGARGGPVIQRPHLTVARRPNEVWSVDFKGWFRVGDARRVDPLTVRDMATCFLIAVELIRNQSVEHTRQLSCASSPSMAYRPRSEWITVVRLAPMAHSV
jgi:transposase